MSESPAPEPQRRVEFRIGDAFPADDPVARWITVLAMWSNDFLRMFNWIETAETEGTRLLGFRLSASAYYEAANHLRTTLRLWPEVKAFADNLGSEAAAEMGQIEASITPGSDGYLGDWLVEHRHITFHYAAIHPDKVEHGAEAVANALDEAKDITGAITAGAVRNVRFEFADDVATQWLPDVETDEGAAVVDLRDASLRLMRFAHGAADAYLIGLPNGAVRMTSKKGA
ncbi:MAG: hypothetical protein ACR2G3_03390 [Solirubrobacterales bacterium]